MRQVETISRGMQCSDSDQPIVLLSAVQAFSLMRGMRPSPLQMIIVDATFTALNRRVTRISVLSHVANHWVMSRNPLLGVSCSPCSKALEQRSPFNE